MLKKINNQEKERLSYKDIEQEVKQIKIVEFNIGKDNRKIQITKLTERQQSILDALNIKINDIETLNVATNRKK